VEIGSARIETGAGRACVSSGRPLTYLNEDEGSGAVMPKVNIEKKMSGFEFSIVLDGDKIDMSKFLEAVGSFLRLLRSVEAGDTVAWKLATLHYSSPAVIGCVGSAKKKDAPNNASVVARRVMEGLDKLEQGERPKTFSDEALEAAKRLSEMRGRGGIKKVAVIGQNGGKPVTSPLGPKVAATVDDLIGPKYDSIGSVHGRLVVVSARGGVLSCSIHDKASGKAVRCEFPDPLKASVLGAFDSTVVGFGRVSRDSSGNPRVIQLTSIEPSEDNELPQSLAGIDPDITEGLDVVEYLKRRWE